MCAVSFSWMGLVGRGRGAFCHTGIFLVLQVPSQHVCPTSCSTGPASGTCRLTSDAQPSFSALPVLQVHNVRGPHDMEFYMWLDKIQAVSCSCLCGWEAGRGD